MRAPELDEEVVRLLANRKHLAESLASPVAAIGHHSAHGPAAAMPRCPMPPRLHNQFLVPQSGECASASFCSISSSSRSSSPGSILHEQHQRHQRPPRSQQQQRQQQQQQQQQQPLQQQEGAQGLMKFKSLQVSPIPSAPHSWGLPGSNGKPSPLSSHRSAEPVCTPDPHSLLHQRHVSESSSVRSSTSSSSSTVSCHRAPPKHSATYSPLSGHAGPSSLPNCHSLQNLASQATSPPMQLLRRAKAGSPMRMLPQPQQRQKQQATAAPQQAPPQGPNKWPVPPATAPSSSSRPRCMQEVAFPSCPNTPFAVASQPQKQRKRFAQDGTLSSTILACAEEKLLELAAIEGERACHPDSQGQAHMGPPSTGSPAKFWVSAAQRHLQPSCSEASLLSLPATAHKINQLQFVQPGSAQTTARAELDQQQRGSNLGSALASVDLNGFPADLDPTINNADALKLCLGMLRGTGKPPSCSDEGSSTPRNNTPRPSPLSMAPFSRAITHSLNHSMSYQSSGSPADGSKAGSRLSRHAGCRTLDDIGPKGGDRGLRPWGGVQATSKAAPASASHHEEGASTSRAHQKVVALQGSPAGSDLSSWHSYSSLLPSECSTDLLTFHEHPHHQHHLYDIKQCRSQGGLQLVDGARRRACRMSNLCNAKAQFSPQGGANSATAVSPQSSPPRMPHQKQGSRCLCATNAVAFDEEAAELAEREYMAVSQKAHGSLDSESPEFMMAVAQLQAYRPIFIAPNRRPKVAKPKSGNTAGGAAVNNDREEIEQIVRSQHEEALTCLLNRTDARQSRCTSPAKQQQRRPEERCPSQEPKKEMKSDCKHKLQEEVADMELESIVNEPGVSEVVQDDEEHADAAGELANERQEEVAALPEERKQPAAAATVCGMANGTPPQAETESWKLRKMTASADVEGGFALEPGEFPDDGKPPVWKPWRPLDLAHVRGWGFKESPADEKPSPWKPVRPLNPDYYGGSWSSKEPPAGEKLPAWKPVQPCNPDHYDGSWGSKSPERSSPAVSPVLWKPFWHTNPVDLSDLRPIGDGPGKKGKPLQPLWRL